MTRTKDNQAARGRDEWARERGDRHGPNSIATVCASEKEAGPMITAVLQRGPLAGRHIDVNVVEGRPPKTTDVRADDGSTCRYCLADWTQTGSSARYSFLYLV